MFSLSLGEILLIAVVLFVFIKPEELPGLFRKIGHVLGELNKIKSEFKQMASKKPEEDKKDDIK